MTTKKLDDNETIRWWFQHEKQIALEGQPACHVGEKEYTYYSFEDGETQQVVLYWRFAFKGCNVEAFLKGLGGATLYAIILKQKETCQDADDYELLYLDDMKKLYDENHGHQNKDSKIWSETMGAEELANKKLMCSTLDELRESIDSASEEFIRTTSFCRYEVEGHYVKFDLRDLLLIGAVTEVDVLLTGKTGSGKTKLANAVMGGLFGTKGYYSKTTLPSMSQADFVDIDFKKMAKSSQKKAIHSSKFLSNPGIVLNEINRAPAVVQSMMIAFFDREFEFLGKPLTLGKETSDGSHYQYRILTINEGPGYDVYPIDPAIRDRMTIEIPIDAFPQSYQNVMDMLNSEKEEKTGKEETGHFETIYNLSRLMKTIPVSDHSRRFLAYLSGLSYCIRSDSGNKETIEINRDLCDGCMHFTGIDKGKDSVSFNYSGICPEVRAPSARIILNLQKVARAFALFRVWKDERAGQLEVTHEDIVEAAPFLLYSKLNINTKWIEKHHRGDRWTTIREFLIWLYEERFLPFMGKPDSLGSQLHAAIQEGNISPDLVHNVKIYVKEKDPWAYSCTGLDELEKEALNKNT